MLTQQLEEKQAMAKALTTSEQQCQALKDQLAALNIRLQPLTSLDSQVEAQQQILQENQKVSELYLRHRNAANSFKDLDQQTPSYPSRASPSTRATHSITSPMAAALSTA
ncbi:MAG: hypothetical protein HC792_00280 [Acaryochloridaceae cyanobacterium CSU_5_19]|nr:hypothetical protein [Acaryochloridaceae cyanobacterium CSU_5_19]